MKRHPNLKFMAQAGLGRDHRPRKRTTVEEVILRINNSRDDDKSQYRGHLLHATHYSMCFMGINM